MVTYHGRGLINAQSERAAVEILSSSFLAGSISGLTEITKIVDPRAFVFYASSEGVLYDSANEDLRDAYAHDVHIPDYHLYAFSCDYTRMGV